MAVIREIYPRDDSVCIEIHGDSGVRVRLKIPFQEGTCTSVLQCADQATQRGLKISDDLIRIVEQEGTGSLESDLRDRRN